MACELWRGLGVGVKVPRASKVWSPFQTRRAVLVVSASPSVSDHVVLNDIR